jgi:hypothetical protein
MRPHLINKYRDQRHGSGGRALTEEQSPEFKLQFCQKQRKKRIKKECPNHYLFYP